MKVHSINNVHFLGLLLGITLLLPGHFAPAAAVTIDETWADKLIDHLLKPWKGDLDGIVEERRSVRMLVVFSRTNFSIDKGHQRGLTCQLGKLFEKFLNERLKTGPIKMHIQFVPVRRDQLFQALEEGRGDIAAANLTITPERQQWADFSVPAGRA